MANTCMIKSHPKGIALVLDGQCEFETLVLDVCELFAGSKDFFGEGPMPLSFEGRDLSPKETLILIEAIELNSSITVPYVIDENEMRDVRTVGKIDRFFFDRVDTNAKIVRGSVNAGERIESDTGIIIIGDVKKNATVSCAGNAIILGKLEGDVRAGEPSFNNACIVAGKFLAKSATIGGVTGEVNIRYRGLRTARLQTEPVVVKLLHGYFHAEPLSSGLATQDED